MKRNFNIKITIFLIVTFSMLSIGVALAGVYNLYRTATYAALASSFSAFLVLLEIKQDRVLKGFLLIGAGVLYQLLYPKFFYIFVDKALAPADAITHFEIFGQVILLACAGAGGSIIAAHADKTSSDYEESKIEKTVIDNTKHMEILIYNTNRLNQKINTAIVISVITSIIGAAAVITLLITLATHS